MARKNTTASKTPEAKQAELLVPFEIRNVRWGKDNKYAYFNLDLVTLGITLYSMKLVYNKDGEPFLAPAQTKGSNGEWYNNYFVRISAEMAKGIIDLVEAE